MEVSPEAQLIYERMSHHAKMSTSPENVQHVLNVIGCGWIKCEDRLPDSCIEVFIWPRPEMHGEKFTGEYQASKNRWISYCEDNWGVEPVEVVVTHWMALPTPPPATSST